MTVQWVLPSIDPFFRAACLDTMADDVRERLCLVDNTIENKGVSLSWNIGIDAAEASGASWLVVLSESIRFGAAGGHDIEAALQECAPALQGMRCDATCTEVYETGQGFCRRGYGWHLIGVHRDLWTRVGRFDPIFWPGGHEDADFYRRIVLAGLLDNPPVIDRLDAHLIACEHTVADGWLAGVKRANTAALFAAKWGTLGDPRLEPVGYAHPYDDPTLDLTYTGHHPLTPEIHPV